MSSPIERTSRANLNGAVQASVLPGQRTRRGSGFSLVGRPGSALRGYGWAELAERVDVSIATLRDWVLCGFFRPSGIGLRGGGPGVGTGPGTGLGAGPGSRAVPGAGFAAVDVVRLEVLVRLVRSGVPVARAAELLSTTE
jgi:hypothetical protein